MTFPLSDRILGDASNQREIARSLSLEGEGRGEGVECEKSPDGPVPFEAQMAEFYKRVDEEIASHSPICRNRGLCCKFAAYGHRLYVTEPERTYFARGLTGQWRPVSPDQSDCPYHINGVCTARTHRPLGCRVFFCDEAAQEWQGPVYERFLAELKQIGQTHGLAYAYSEWLSALQIGP